MSFQGVEISQFNGDLIELYHFVVGTVHHRFVSGATVESLDVDDGNGVQTWTPAVIGLSEPEHSRDSSQLRVGFTVTRDNPVALAFRASLPGFELPVFVYRKHISDGEVRNWFAGSVKSCQWRESYATLTAEPTLAKISRLGLSKRYQYQCNLTPYSTRCGVDVADFTDSVTVTAIDGAVVTVSGMPTHAAEFEANWYVGGSMVDMDGNRRFITAQDGNDLTLNLDFEDLAVTDVVSIIAGDDRSEAVCRGKFFPAGGSLVVGVGNIANHFGFFTIPGRNPFKVGLANAKSSGFATFDEGG